MISCTIGNPGQTESAKIDVLDNCVVVDVGKLLEEEDMNVYVVFEDVPVWRQDMEVVFN